MDAVHVCPQCQQPVPPDAPKGACPACLLHLALTAEPPVADQPTLETLTDARPGAAAPAGGFVPRPFAGFDLLAELGRGGMGVVYRAQQRTPHRVVALKVLRSGEHAGTDELARFRTEVEAVAALNHPHVVQVYEVGEHMGLPYFSMELVEGGSLAERLRRGPLPPAEAAALAEVLARAVHAVHQAGVVHRDLTPSNVLLSPDGTPKVTDFGLAKRLDPASPGRKSGEHLTVSGAIMGTPSYIAPEQASGQSRSAGPAADVYALGALLYEMLTGRPPFQAATAVDTILRVLTDEPVPPRQLQPRLPRDLNTICLKCLHKEPQKRYASAAALADDLRRFQEGRPVTARPAGQFERTWRWCRRNPAVASLLAAVAVLLVTVTVVSVFSAVQNNAALVKITKAEREARLREADALVGQAHGTRYSRRPGQRFDALAALGKAAAIGRELDQPSDWFDRLRNEAIAALALPDIHITQSWDGYPPGTDKADVSHEFDLYARTNGQGECWVQRITDNSEVAHLPPLGKPARPALGPGRLLVHHEGISGRFQLWNLSGPEPTLRREEREPVSAWDFRRDGQLFALKYRDNSLVVYETDTLTPRHRLTAGAGQASPPLHLHPSEPLAADEFGEVLHVCDLRTGTELASVTLPWRDCGGVAWSPDGRSLAVACGYNGQVHLYAFDSSNHSLRLVHRLDAPGNGGTSVQFNPSGDRLVTRGWNGRVYLFDAHTGRLLFSTPSRGTGETYLRFDPLGQRLAAARVGVQAQQIGLWSVADVREYRALVRHEPGQRWNRPFVPAVHPKGRLAVREHEEGFVLFDLETGSELGLVPLAGGVIACCFDGNGNLITNSPAGVFRWPVCVDPVRPERMTIGPSERLSIPGGNRSIAASRDGRVIAQAIFKSGAWVLHPGELQPRRLMAGDVGDYISVSHDGRWVAVGQHDTRVNVYETATGQLAWLSPADGHHVARFSPDGGWLLTENDGGRAYAIGTWEPGPQLGPGWPSEVSPDSRLVTMGLAEGVYRLVELATGRELARLEDPERDAGPAVFTPDGTRLVCAADDGLRVWDLRRIRAELVKLGLDWDAPPYPAPGPAVNTPLEVRVVGAEGLAEKKDGTKK